MNRRTPMPRPKKPMKRTRLRRRSTVKALRDTIYSVKRKAFLAEAGYCEACQLIWREEFDHKVCLKATQVHHKHGRYGKNYLDTSTWIAVSARAHKWIHDHPNPARKLGLLAPR